MVAGRPMKRCLVSWVAAVAIVGGVGVPMALASPAAASARRPAPGAGVLTIVQGTEPDTLDNARTILGASYAVFSQIYDTLVVPSSPTATAQFAGEIAKSWTVSKNGLVYTFAIRPGLRFSNGDPLNAAAVAFTFNRIMSPATKSPALGEIGPISKAAATGPLQVTVTLSQPFAYELSDLSSAYAGIEDPKAVQSEGAQYGRSPVGSGPFMVKSWISGESITLVPNPYYHGFESYVANHGQPHLKALRFIFIPNTESQIAALQSGEANLIEYLPSQNYGQFKSSPAFHVQPFPGLDLNYLEFKDAKHANGSVYLPAPFNSVLVRRAVGFAIDSQGVLSAANFGLGQVEYGLVPAGMDAYDPALKSIGFHYDPALARKLLTQAGWKAGPGGVRYKDGRPLTDVLWVYAGDPYTADGQIIVNELNAVGFKATLQALPIATLIAEITTGHFNMNLVGLGGSNSSIFNTMLSLEGTGFPAPPLLKMLTRAAATQNAQARIRLYDQAQVYVLQNAYMVPIYSDSSVAMWASNVHGVVINSIPAFNFVDATVGG